MGKHAKPAGNVLQRFLASFTYQPRHNGRQPVKRTRTAGGNARTQLAERDGTPAAYRSRQGAVRQYARSEAVGGTTRRRPR